MQSSKNIPVIIADEIHHSGIDKLIKKRFKVLKYYRLDNLKLLEKLSKLIEPSILIVRTFRKFSSYDIQKIHKETNVKLICTCSSGYDNLNPHEAKRFGIYTMNVPYGSYISAAEHTVALILAVVKNVDSANRDMKRGIFDFKRYNNSELYGKTIGIIGVGKVGSHVAKIAKSFGMNIIGNDIKKSLKSKYKWIKFVSLSNLLSTSDIITVHTPLGNSTRDLINNKNIGLIKQSSIVINCARGEIINESVLYKSLKNKKLFFAGLDVFNDEPNFDKRFTKLSNVILTPHLGGKSKESKERMSSQLADRIIDFTEKHTKLFN